MHYKKPNTRDRGSNQFDPNFLSVPTLSCRWGRYIICVQHYSECNSSIVNFSGIGDSVLDDIESSDDDSGSRHSHSSRGSRGRRKRSLKQNDMQKNVLRVVVGDK